MYGYILDIELMPDRLHESDEVIIKVAKLWGKLRSSICFNPKQEMYIGCWVCSILKH